MPWIILLLVLFAFGCDNSGDDYDSGTGGDTDTDSDSDTDSDGDSDSDTDTGDPVAIVWIDVSVDVTGGEFEMGCSPGDTDCYDAESPVHTVTVAPFEMTEAEITQLQFEEELGENPSWFSGCPNCPVDSVTWHEAVEFCEAIGGRLPTEAEWEYAARGGTISIYVCGDNPACLDDVAWYLDNSDIATHPVKEKEANDFGFYDMQGNAWEWVQDSWHDDYTDAPTDGSAWEEGPESYRVVRSGCFGLDALGMRVSNRSADYPDNYYIPYPGFRCARDLE
jgi:formylglycine-generating enzyme required for sulfatase activity